jgi:predicted secreted Zn-dependent protease
MTFHHFLSPKKDIKKGHTLSLRCPSILTDLSCTIVLTNPVAIQPPGIHNAAESLPSGLKKTARVFGISDVSHTKALHDRYSQNTIGLPVAPEPQTQTTKPESRMKKRKKDAMQCIPQNIESNFSQMWRIPCFSALPTKKSIISGN